MYESKKGILVINWTQIGRLLKMVALLVKIDILYYWLSANWTQKHENYKIKIGWKDLKKDFAQKNPAGLDFHRHI